MELIRLRASFIVNLIHKLGPQGADDQFKIPRNIK